MDMLVISDYNSFLDTFKALLSAFIGIFTSYFDNLFRMQYFGLNLGKLFFAFTLLSIVFYAIFNVLRGRDS